MPRWSCLTVYNPFWSNINDPTADLGYYTLPQIAQAGGFNSRNTGGGVTYSNATAHPLASTLNERGIKFDGNVAEGSPSNGGHRLQLFMSGQVYFINDGGLPSTYRSAVLLDAYIFQDTGASRPATDALISKTANFQFWYRAADQKFDLKDGSGTLIGTTSIALTAGTPCWIEIYAAGRYTVDATARWFVRMTTGTPLSGAGRVTTIAVDATHGTPIANPQASGSAHDYGELTQRGAGFEFYLWNIVPGGWVHADDPPGIIRADHIWADGLGHTSEWTGASALNVDDTGANVAPSGADSDSMNILNGTTKTQLYTLTSPVNIGASDTILAAHLSTFCAQPANSKSANYTNWIIWSDGTNDFVSSGGGSTDGRVLHDAPNNAYEGGFTLADLGSLQLGRRGNSNGADGTFNIYEISAIIAYQKAGEGLGALPDEMRADLMVPQSTPIFQKTSVRPY